MKYNVISANKLTQDLIQRWIEIQETNSELSSPYFSPYFTKSVAKFRDDVRLAMMEDGEKIVGFFPYHIDKKGFARPIGLALSDYHGIIAEKNVQWKADDLLRNCRIVRWEFDHLITTQTQFKEFHTDIAESPIIDLAEGKETYEKSLNKSGRKQFKEVMRKKKKLEEQVGTLTYTHHTTDLNVFEQLVSWKSMQCQVSGTIDYFKIDWCQKLVRYIHSLQRDGFGGILSSLYAGDRLAAVHFAMYSKNVWHSWFPAYNNDLQQYSPGLILLYEMINDAANRGIKHIDLGKGLSLYKKRVMNNGIPVAEGCIELPSLHNFAKNTLGAIENWSRQSVFKPVLRIPGRLIKSIERKKRYE